MSTTRRGRRGYHHGDLRAAIQRAGARLLEHQGRAALSLREAARRAGVSHNAPYRHFADRESLLAAIAADGFEALGGALQGAARRGGLRAMGEAYVRFAMAQPQRFRLMFGGELRAAKHAALRQSATRLYARLATTLETQLPGEAGRYASLAAWSLVHGLTHLLLDERVAAVVLRGRSRDELVRAVLDSIRFAAAKPYTPL